MSDEKDVKDVTGSKAPSGESPKDEKAEQTPATDSSEKPGKKTGDATEKAGESQAESPKAVSEKTDGNEGKESKEESTKTSTGPGDKKTSAPAPSGARSDARRGGFRDRDQGVEKYWVPNTRLGKLVREGKLTTIEDVLNSGLVLREPEIVDILLGEMQDEVIDVNMVQRMTDSGRRVRFAVTVAVGNENGYLGVGRAHGKEVGPTIRKAIDNAKINIISLKRGCGSWECGCGSPHSIPFKTEGKAGSVVVTFLPAPKGVGLAVGDVAKKILKLGGVKDLWATTKGQTQTTWNYASAVYEALMNLSRMRINQHQHEKFRILTGGDEE